MTQYFRTWEQVHNLLVGNGYKRVWGTSDGKANIYKHNELNEVSVIYCKDKGYRLTERLVKS